jgi:hypothetical protein
MKYRGAGILFRRRIEAEGMEVLTSPPGWPALNGEHERAEWWNPVSGLPASTHCEARRAIAAQTERRHARTK